MPQIIAAILWFIGLGELAWGAAFAIGGISLGSLLTIIVMWKLQRRERERLMDGLALMARVGLRPSPRPLGCRDGYDTMPVHDKIIDFLER